jgi:uncharacterized protein (TIGR00725 family)
MTTRKPAVARKITIAVIGGGECTAEEAKLAKQVGQEIAKRGAILVCGGLGGVMEAACRGAADRGGITVGILPGENTETANTFVQIPIATGLGEARNLAIVKTAQALIAVGGEYGTLSEIAFALKGRKPVIGLGTWSLCRNRAELNSIFQAESAEEAVEKAFSMIKKRKMKGEQ